MAALDSTLPDHLSRGLEEPPAALALRREAWRRYESLPWPDAREEVWRRTDARRFQPKDRDFGPPPPADIPGIPADWAGQGTDLLGTVLEHNGRAVAPGISPAVRAAGIEILDLSRAWRDPAGRFTSALHAALESLPDRFGALWNATLQAGTVLVVPAGRRVEMPLGLVRVFDGNRRAVVPLLLVIVERGASLNLLEERRGSGEESTLILHRTESVVQADAALDHTVIQRWTTGVNALGFERTLIAERAQSRWTGVSLGGGVVKTHHHTELRGAGSTARVRGLECLGPGQHQDWILDIRHSAPDTQGEVEFRRALRGNSKSSFRGTLKVELSAPRTVTHLSDHALLMSPEAVTDSVPVLEILAKDVVCKHAAAMGRLDEELRFYCLSRGIPASQVDPMLTLGFFEKLLDAVKPRGAGEVIQRWFQEKLLPSGAESVAAPAPAGAAS